MDKKTRHPGLPAEGGKAADVRRIYAASVPFCLYQNHLSRRQIKPTVDTAVAGVLGIAQHGIPVHLETRKQHFFECGWVKGSDFGQAPLPMVNASKSRKGGMRPLNETLVTRLPSPPTTAPIPGDRYQPYHHQSQTKCLDAYGPRSDVPHRDCNQWVRSQVKL